MYLPNQNKNNMPQFDNKTANIVVITIVIAILFGFFGGFLANYYLKNLDLTPKANNSQQYIPQTSQEDKTIRAVRNSSPAVVSIIISKDLPILEEYFVDPFQNFLGPSPFQIPQYRQNGTQKQEIGGGSGFIVSTDGTVVTNKHVVADEEAEYTVLTNDGQRYSAKVIAKDPVQDLAVIKIESEKKDFATVNFGDSAKLQIGQTVIAIGNALGEFRNTVSVGVVSGLGRTVTASGGNQAETLEDIIQTDAAINKGNSGGPLLNLAGEVIGINTAMALDAESIGFAIPINKVKKAIDQAKTSGKIVYPFLGVNYVLINDKVKEENKLSVDYGALIIAPDSGGLAVAADSAAAKAGLKEKDIILELNSEKITIDNSLAKVILKYNPGDKVILKVLRSNEEITIEATLGERK